MSANRTTPGESLNRFGVEATNSKLPLREEEPLLHALTIEQLVQLARDSAYRAKLLTQTLKLAPRTLSRRFHDELNCSPGEWLAQRRMCDAMAMLRAGLTIKEAADALGYRQLPQFSREFRRRVGCTASEFAARYHAPPTLLLRVTEMPMVTPRTDASTASPKPKQAKQGR